MNKLTKPLLGLLFWISMFFLGWFLLSVLPGCTKNQPNEPPEQFPPDTVFIEVPVFVACDTVDLVIEFTLIKDQSAPNVYAILRNGVEVDRIVISDTALKPTEVIFVKVFERFVIGQETIAIKRIEGSRAETIGSAIIAIRCSSGFGWFSERFILSQDMIINPLFGG